MSYKNKGDKNKLKLLHKKCNKKHFKNKNSKTYQNENILISQNLKIELSPKNLHLFLTTCALSTYVLSFNSYAQTPTGAPGVGAAALSASPLAPSQIAQPNLSALSTLSKGNPVDQLPKIEVDSPNKVKVEIEKKSSPLQTVEEQTVNIKEVRIKGVESLDFKEVSALFTPLTNKEIKIKEFIEATKVITQKYKDAGYLLSFAYLPQQNFNDGVANITIVEGYVKDIKITGVSENNEARIEKILTLLKEAKPLTRKTFERVDGILGLQPGLKVSLNIPAPTTTEGGTTVEAKIEQKKYDINVGIQAQKPQSQLVVAATVNSLTPLGDQLTVSTLLPPGEKSVRYYALNYAAPLSSNGLIGKIDFSSYREKPKAPSLLSQGYESEYNNETSRLTFSALYPLILESKKNWNVSGGVYLNRERLDYYPQAQYRLFSPNYTSLTHLSVLFLETNYTRIEEKGSHQLSATISKGINSFGAKTYNTEDDTSFTKLKLQAQKNWSLPKNFEVRLKGVYQYSPDKLARSERISFGQRFYGAGYQAGEIEGDKGWGISTELNYTWKTEYEYLKVLQPYIGYEKAHVSFNRPVNAVSMTSAILGARLSNNKNYFLDLSVGKPIGKAPSDNVRLRYGLTYSFKY